MLAVKPKTEVHSQTNTLKCFPQIVSIILSSSYHTDVCSVVRSAAALGLKFWSSSHTSVWEENGEEI